MSIEEEEVEINFTPHFFNKEAAVRRNTGCTTEFWGFTRKFSFSCYLQAAL